MRRIALPVALLTLVSCGGDNGGGTTPTQPVTPVATTIQMTFVAGAEMFVRDTATVLAVVLDQQGQVMPNATVVWSSNAEDVARVDAIGLVTAEGKGEAVITAASGATSATIQVSVNLDQIVFFSDISGNDDIYLMDSEGSVLAQLTDNPGQDRMPAWSPDGSQVAFESRRDGNSEIYVVSVDGSGETRVTNSEWDEFSPAWSPDGQRLAFVSTRDGNQEVYVSNLDGSAEVRITENPGNDRNPAWSPDGSRIAFDSERDDNRDLYVLEVVTGALTRLTNWPDLDLEPTWSPDGALIAYRRFDGEVREIFVVGADGSNPTNLSQDGTALFYYPDWSPDGRKLSYSYRTSRVWSIWQMDPDGSNRERIREETGLIYGGRFRPR